MLTYNTRLKELRLPEYGRNIQNMVDFCLGLESREERTRCAYAIVNAMATLFPAQKDDDEENIKFWDHLALMSDFKLDIDWPVEPLRPEEIAPKPDLLPYDLGGVKRRQYGSNLEHMVAIASEMEEGENRDAIIYLLANQMKKDILANDRSDDPDERIYRELYEMSDGRIRVDATTCPLIDYNMVESATGKKKKKK